jgi:hypothetical protein
LNHGTTRAGAGESSEPVPLRVVSWFNFYMGAVGQTQQQNNLDAGGLSQYLDSQKQEAEETAPDLMGALNSMLDSNRDGGTQDDVGRLLGSFFK